MRASLWQNVPERPRGADAGRSVAATARIRARKAERRDDNGWPAPPAEPSAPPDFGVRTPDACAWDANGRYSRWHLPTHSGRPAWGPDTDFQKMLLGQRDKIMRQGDGEGSN
jgi:hypothetical protein